MSLFGPRTIRVEHRGMTVIAKVRGKAERFERGARDWIDWWLDRATPKDRALNPSLLLDATWQRLTAGTTHRATDVRVSTDG